MCEDDHTLTPSTSIAIMADQVLSDFGLKEMTEQDMRDFSECSTQDPSLCTTNTRCDSSGVDEARPISLHNIKTETQTALSRDLSHHFVSPESRDNISPFVTPIRLHNNKLHPSVLHFPVTRPTPPSASHTPQMGTLLSTKLTHPHSRIPLKVAVCFENPGHYTRQQLASLGACPSTGGVTSATAGTYRFVGARHFSEAVQRGGVEVCLGDGAMAKVSGDGTLGVKEMWEAFSRSPGVDWTLVSPEWFSNHYRWVVWKLSAMEVCFPRILGGRCLTPDWLMLQMKYRYDREIDLAQRPALRKICEGDDVPSRTMVLCVSHIDYDLLQGPSHQAQVSFGNDSKVASSPDLPCVVLTDGWYSLPGILDSVLKHAVRRGMVCVGTKVVTSGAELVGGSGPTHPLEAPPTLALKLSANSTRRVRWFARLGYHRSPLPIRVPLGSVLPTGGLVGNTEALVCRVYPLVFMERVVGGGVVFRNGRVEEGAESLYQARRQREMEKVYQRVQREMEDEVAREEGGASRRRSRRLIAQQAKRQVTSRDPEEMYDAFMSAADPQQFQESLSPGQLYILEGHRQALTHQRQAELQRRVAQAITEAEDTLTTPREVVPLLKLRVVAPDLLGGSDPLGCILCVWRPSEDVRETLKEGRAFRVFNVVASPGHTQLPCRLQLTATKSTRYLEVTFGTEGIYVPRSCASICGLSSYQLPYGEFDTVGMVTSVVSSSPPGKESSDGKILSKKMDTVHLTDASRSILVIHVWGGLEAHGLQSVVVPGAVVGVFNLTYRGTNEHHHPVAYAGDLSLFTLHPQEHLKAPWEELNKALQVNRNDMLQTLQSNIVVEY